MVWTVILFISSIFIESYCDLGRFKSYHKTFEHICPWSVSWTWSIFIMLETLSITGLFYITLSTLQASKSWSLYKCRSVLLLYKSLQEAQLWGRLSVERPQVHFYSPGTSDQCQMRSVSFYSKMEQSYLQMSGPPTPSSPVRVDPQDWGR